VRRNDPQPSTPRLTTHRARGQCRCACTCLLTHSNTQASKQAFQAGLSGGAAAVGDCLAGHFYKCHQLQGRNLQLWSTPTYGGVAPLPDRGGYGPLVPLAGVFVSPLRIYLPLRQQPLRNVVQASGDATQGVAPRMSTAQQCVVPSS